jgi:hypothetical protein
MSEERRGPGRPPNGRPSWEVAPRSVRLSADVDDALCRLALRHGVSVHALMRLAAIMLIEDGDNIVRRHQNTT